jgi:hypothetical protein
MCSARYYASCDRCTFFLVSNHRLVHRPRLLQVIPISRLSFWIDSAKTVVWSSLTVASRHGNRNTWCWRFVKNFGVRCMSQPFVLYALNAGISRGRISSYYRRLRGIDVVSQNTARSQQILGLNKEQPEHGRLYMTVTTLPSVLFPSHQRCLHSPVYTHD